MSRDARLFLVLAVCFMAAVLVLNWNTWKLDMTAIYYAARSWHLGARDLVYAPGPEMIFTHPPQAWLDHALAEGWEDPFFTPFLYPPLWAALLAPVAGAVSAGAFFNGVMVASAAATVWMVWLSWAALRPTTLRPPVFFILSFGLILFSAIGYMSFWFGQAQPIVAAITLAAFVALANGRDISAGALLALAAALKLSPALLVILFIMEKRWRALGAFVVVGAGFGLASLIVGGWGLHAELLDKLGQIEERVLVSRITVSLELVLFQIQELVQGKADWIMENPRLAMEPAWIGWVVSLFLIAGLVLSWWATRDVAPRLRIWSRFLAVSMVTLIANPLGWVHYLILPLAMLPGLFDCLPRRTAIIAVAAIGGVLSMPVFFVIRVWPLGDFLQVAINLAVSMAILVLVLVGARREANPSV